LIPTPDKDRNCKRQSNPLAAFYHRLALIQAKAPLFVRDSFWSHLGGQIIGHKRRKRI
jgi:hypothetical protein